MLAPTTKSQYRSQLRRLWEIYKLMPDADDRKPALLAQITRMCDKLGYEIDRLDVVLYAQRGRPVKNPDVSDLAAELKLRKEDPSYWTPEAIDARAKLKMKESEERLKQMMQQHGGDKGEGSKTTDEAKQTGGTTRSDS